MAARRTPRRSAGRPPRRPSDRSRHRVRRGHGASVRPERGARRLPHDRRRADLGEGALRRSQHRRDRRSSSTRSTRAPSTPRCGSTARGRGRTASFSGPNSGLYKSTDGGTTWRRLSKGLPKADRGSRYHLRRRAQQSEAPLRPGRRPRDRGRYSARTTAARPGRGSARPPPRRRHARCIPTNPDVVFAAGTCGLSIGRRRPHVDGHQGRARRRRSAAPLDQPAAAGHHAAHRRPGRDDHRQRRPDLEFLVQPADGAALSRDDRQPVPLLGLRRAAGERRDRHRQPRATAARSRSATGSASAPTSTPTSRPTRSIRDIVYGGRVQRFDRRTGQSQNVAPEALRSGKYRILRTMPLLFHPADPRMLLFATNVLWKTTTGGQQWEIISPDLSRERPAVPESVGDFRTADLEHDAAARRHLRGRPVAAGRQPDLGRHRRRAGSRDARRREDVDERDAAGAAPVGQGVADRWPATSTRRRPTSPSTRSAATTCARISTARTTAAPRGRASSNGLPEMGPVNVVREDPKQPGLLFAGTERAVYVSADDGERWQPLRQNMPASSIRDLVIHDDDLVVGTHGRSIWILDNIAPLRELAEAARSERAHLFGPALATRVRWNMFSDTPLPPEEPAGANPPDGATLDYYLPRPAGEVAIEILDADGGVVRRFSSRDPADAIDPAQLPYPTYWFRPPQRISADRGPPPVRVGPALSAAARGERARSRSPRSTGTRRAGRSGRSCTRGATACGSPRMAPCRSAISTCAWTRECRSRQKTCRRRRTCRWPAIAGIPAAGDARRDRRVLKSGAAPRAAGRPAGAPGRGRARRSRHHVRQHLRGPGLDGNRRRAPGEVPAHAESARRRPTRSRRRRHGRPRRPCRRRWPRWKRAGRRCDSGGMPG